MGSVIVPRGRRLILVTSQWNNDAKNKPRPYSLVDDVAIVVGVRYALVVPGLHEPARGRAKCMLYADAEADRRIHPLPAVASLVGGDELTERDVVGCVEANGHRGTRYDVDPRVSTHETQLGKNRHLDVVDGSVDDHC